MNARLQASLALAAIGLFAVAITHKAEACGLSLIKNAVPGFPITGIVVGTRLTIDSPVSY